MAAVREYRASDEESLVALSLRAWEPVFDALLEALGSELFLRLRGDWRTGQAREVRDVLADSTQRVWVAEDAGQRAIGFVAAKLHREHAIGEIYRTMAAGRPSGASGSGGCRSRSGEPSVAVGEPDLAVAGVLPGPLVCQADALGHSS